MATTRPKEGADAAENLGFYALRSKNFGLRRQAAKLCYRFGPLTPSARSANLIAGDGTKNGFPVGSRTGAPVGRGIPTVPRFQPPPRRTQHADFPHCAPPFASRQGLWDLSYRGNFRSVVSHSIAVEQS